MTQMLNVSSAVERRLHLFQCFRIRLICKTEVGQKSKQENGTKWLRMFPATGKLAFFISSGLAEGLVFRATFAHDLKKNKFHTEN